MKLENMHIVLQLISFLWEIYLQCTFWLCSYRVSKSNVWTAYINTLYWTDCLPDVLNTLYRLVPDVVANINHRWNIFTLAEHAECSVDVMWWGQTNYHQSNWKLLILFSHFNSFGLSFKAVNQGRASWQPQQCCQLQSSVVNARKFLVCPPTAKYWFRTL